VNLTTKYASFNELSQPYTLYNWEMGFHGPIELADHLHQGQNFDAALETCHSVFNPYADGPGAKRMWKWRPFAEVDTASLVETLFNTL
jgi:hypothetical protein